MEVEEYGGDWSEESEDEGHTLDDVTLLPNVKGYITRGKYKGLVLPRMLSVKPGQQDKVEALKAEIIADPEFKRHASALATEYAAIRREKDKLKDDLKECNLRLEAVAQLMADQFEVEDATGITLKETGANVRVQPEPHTVITNKEEFRVWCIEDHLERLMTLPWATANKLVKSRLLDGLPEPDGAQAYFRNKIVFKKGV